MAALLEKGILDVLCDRPLVQVNTVSSIANPKKLGTVLRAEVVEFRVRMARRVLVLAKDWYLHKVQGGKGA